MAWLEPVRLQGSRASLAPLTHGHANDLVEALRDGELWKLWYTSIPAPDTLASFIDQRLAAQANGTCLPFAVLDNATGKAIGMTNYLNIEPDHRRVEIGVLGTGRALALKQMAERGWHADLCLLRPDETAGPDVERRLKAQAYDCVVIGAGIRLPPHSLSMFEAVINAVHRAAPDAAIAFNTRPEDSADAAARWLKAD